ncbi:uncharacterized protein LOC115257886 [Aedes albopictus]|uniref:Uncharacterized protein n=1 Tax=Aedes albopictus TaxID=7160 RepID=A0ABM1ZBJ9_AEDAL
MENTCGKCNNPDTDEMVACDSCEVWFHLECVGETPGVVDQQFVCPKCIGKKEKKGKKGKAEANAPKSDKSLLPKRPTSTESGGNADQVPANPVLVPGTSETSEIESQVGNAIETTSVNIGESLAPCGANLQPTESSMQRELRRLEEKMQQKEKQMEEERILREKQLEWEAKLQRKQLEQDRALRRKKLDQQREIYRIQLQEEAEFRRQEEQLFEDFRVQKDAMQSGENVEKTARPTGHMNREDCSQVRQPVPELPDTPKCVTKSMMPVVKNRNETHQQHCSTQEGYEEPDFESDGDDGTDDDLESTVSRRAGPSRSQMAARQVLSKKLPTFSGKVEEWPLFYSSYVNSTEACGFTEVENLVRLQECLKGSALESVRSRLLLPKAVPQVIATLRMLYGRPEQLIHTLLGKVRKTDPPRADRLESFIPFGMAVQELCDHLEAAELHDHLVNPVLIQELVDKLPAATKREWVHYKRTALNVTLRTFAEFASSIVSEASEVTLTVDLRSTNKPEKLRMKDKGFIQAHTEESNTASPPISPCRICKTAGHRIRNCDEFRRLNISERVKLMERWKLCERCLNEHTGWCRFKITCNVGSCRQPHHPLVHRVAATTSQACQGQLHTHLDGKLPVIFRIVPITLYGGQKSYSTFAYLDEGSDMTLVEGSLVRDLGIRGILQPLTLQWTGNVKRRESASERVALEVASDNGNRLKLKEAHTVKRLYLPRQRVDFQQISSQYPHLRGLNVSNQTGEESKILIGLNNAYLLAPLESRVGNANEPIAVRSHLGWSIYGPREATIATGFLGTHKGYTNQQLHEMIRGYFLDEEPRSTVASLPETAEDRRARELLESTTTKVGGRYQTGLLWKADEVNLPDSYGMAFRRLQGLERRLLKNPELGEQVVQKIEEYQSKCYAHKATPGELSTATPGKVWYLPLNVVINPKKPGKIRLVFDAAAQVNGVSLNSMLLVGPDLLAPLDAVVQKFRERPIAFGADIREMYHQFLMKPEDKHVLRFLFRTSPSNEPDIFMMDVAIFGSACSPASAQYIKNLNASHYADRFPEASNAIVHKHYVDDYMDCADTNDEAIERAQQVRYIHSHAGLEIRNWVSNSPEFLEAMGERVKNDEVSLAVGKEGACERVLGIIWRPSDDVITFSTQMRDDLMVYMTSDIRPTKRIILSCIMSLFDPLGLLAPFTVHGKGLLQDTWRSGCDWDELVNDDCYTKWTRLRAVFPMINQIEIPRCYLRGAPPSAYGTLEAHVFMDASQEYYSCAVYFRFTHEGVSKCALVSAKTKVGPLRPLSIPRMELLAATLGVRLLDTVLANHDVKVSRRFLWTDSSTVLHWIAADPRKYKPFVAYRVTEILQSSRLDEWHYVRSKLNIADILTKWKNEAFFKGNSTWFCGPEFLEQSEENWPKHNRPPVNRIQELRASHMFHSTPEIVPLIDATRMSKWNILLRTMCCVLRFISNCRKRMQRMPIETLVIPKLAPIVRRSICSIDTPLKQEEYETAEHVLWKQAQWECYKDEVATLLRNQKLLREDWLQIPKSSKLYKKSPFLDEFGVLRMEGRIGVAEFVPFDTKFPILLPREHIISYRLIEFYHQRYGHANKDTVYNELRQRFSIPNLRADVAFVMKNCQWCKVRKTQPQTPRMAPLPVERLTPFTKPFSYVGIDYFGPIDVTVGRRTEKRWVVLFTCLNIRAIHLEVAYRLNTESCIMAIRRFVVRRGPPIAIFSDNGTNFKAANKELQKQIQCIDSECANVFTNARTRWSFNPPSAPHMGGIWERMVRSVKEMMSALNEGQRLTDEILLTVIAEAEEIVNSRPLVYQSQDEEAGEAITPNHFVRGSSSGLKDSSIAPANAAEALRNMYHRSQIISDELWKRWLTEYLPSINARSKWLEESKSLVPGDLVFVVDDHGRNGWIRAKVEEVIHGRDGRVRRAKVRTSNGVFLRPVSKLALIEVRASGKSCQETGPGQGLRAGELLLPLGRQIYTLANDVRKEMTSAKSTKEE